VGEPGPPGSPASTARARLDVVATLHQLIDSLTELSSGSTTVPASAPRDLPLLLSAPEAAQLLSLSRAKVLDLANQGEIPSVRLGRSVRIPRESLIAWVNERTNEPQWLRARRLPAWTRGDRSLER
jgi:excisionase family DNA binding protein